MGRQPRSRTLVSICIVAAVLLIGLAGVQYRWATRVAAADVQREKEHLDSGAALFATNFNGIAGAAFSFLETQAWPSLQAGTPVEEPPRLISELYFLDFSAGKPNVRRLGPGGLFVPASLPSWMPIQRCGPFGIDDPPAFVAPVYDDVTATRAGNRATTVRAFQWRPDRCFVARIDNRYLTRTLFPELIHSSFGQIAVREYDFSVTSADPRRLLLFGRPSRIDFSKTFFSLRSESLPGPTIPGASATSSSVRVRRMETVVADIHGVADLYGPGIWQLQIARKGAPLEKAFQGVRNPNLWLSAGVELLLLTGIIFLVIATRRMQLTADQKLEFVAGVSHELRTPASSIAMLSRNLADGLVTAPGKVKRYGELIHEQSGRLNEMVEQVLQYAAIQAQSLPANQRVDVAGLIDEVLAARGEELKTAGFDIEVAVSPAIPPVFGDRRLLYVALDNLLTNARKYAGAGHWIRLSADYSEPDNSVRLRVQDRGAGVDPKERARIFEPFCRGHRAVEEQIPGSGLGLSLVRRAADAYHGDITLETEPGRGCTFTIHLPV